MHAVSDVPEDRPSLGLELVQPVEADSLQIENDAVLLFNVAAHISATEVGVYVRRNKEPSGRS